MFTEYFSPMHSRITVTVLIFDEIQSPIVKSRFHQLALERPFGWGSSSSSVSISRIAPLNQPKSEKFLFTQFTTDFKIYYKTRLLEKKKYYKYLKIEIKKIEEKFKWNKNDGKKWKSRWLLKATPAGMHSSLLLLWIPLPPLRRSSSCYHYIAIQYFFLCYKLKLRLYIYCSIIIIM